MNVLDIAVERNAYGRQTDSFVGEVEAPALGGKMPAVFIRAPKIRRAGAGVEILATLAGEPVLVREGNIVAATFHPELTEDERVHRLVFEPAAGRRQSARARVGQSEALLRRLGPAGPRRVRALGDGELRRRLLRPRAGPLR